MGEIKKLDFLDDALSLDPVILFASMLVVIFAYSKNFQCRAFQFFEAC